MAKTMTEKQDKAYDKKNNIKQGSPKDVKMDKKHGLPMKIAEKGMKKK
jgi:hypothetical protein